MYYVWHAHYYIDLLSLFSCFCIVHALLNLKKGILSRQKNLGLAMKLFVAFKGTVAGMLILQKPFKKLRYTYFMWLDKRCYCYF